jgi:hypothetical protein
MNANKDGSMRFLDLDASGWRTSDDFYDALRKALGSPKGHGAGGEAFKDSMVWGGMNEVEPPYTVRISGTANLAPDIRAAVDEVIDSVKEGRSWRRDNRGEDIDVNVEVVS